uniref:RNA-dependent RNA polymerase n=1 Tax=Sclerotinia sclerotiorum mitovirus 29 TaxID=2231681 RepID=A0A2Z4QKF8_9VIRU|nr:RNA-dependent RNA polymerase [Sclerotinia sclerotiorum mitovirus 29]
MFFKSMKKTNISQKNTGFFSGFKLYSDVYKAGSMISLSNAKHLMLVLKTIGWRVAVLSFLSTKETSRFRMLHNFGVHILKMNRNHGEVYVVKYLKACQLAVQKKLAGQPFSSLREVEPDYNFPRLSKSGLPSVIKTTDRASICNNSYRVIRFWLSLFSLYRVIKIPFNPKLSTITDSFNGSNIHLRDFNSWLKDNSNLLLQKFLSMDIRDLTANRLLPIVKSSPQGPRSYSHLVGSYIGLRDSKDLFKAVQDYISRTNSLAFSTLFSNIEFAISRFGAKSKVQHNHLGKLSFKEEAAGKLRVFAMVDVITQSLLEPLHRTLFALFKKLPNDCTHDQDKGVKYAQELSLKYGCSFGYDLSAATDRLPLSSQIAVLNALFGVGDLWGQILTNRDYVITKNDYGIPEGSLRYAVGQPMGALSSWAMLNLTHHMMVQFCALYTGRTQPGVWYKDYIVLGDDLALFDRVVAYRYLELCKQLGVSINQTKSIIAESRPVLEFAKRTSINAVDVSALPFKELLSSNSFFGRLAVVSRLIRNKWGKDPFKILTLGCKISKDDKNRLDMIYPMVGYLTQLYQNKVIPLSSVLSLITDRTKPLAFFGRNISWMKPKLISQVLKSYFESGEIRTSKLPLRERFFAEVNSITFKRILLHRIDRMVESLDKTDLMAIRVNILGEIITTPALESYMDAWKASGKPLELDKPFVERAYTQGPEFGEFRKQFFMLSPMADIFFLDKGRSYVNIRNLRLGLDVDLSMGTGFAMKTFGFKLKYLNDYRNLKDYYNKQVFVDLELSALLQDLEKLEGIKKTLVFYTPTVINKEIIDNPLKVLDFIKDINDPRWFVKSDFVKFDGKYIESEAYVEERPTFKPQFDFGTKINLDFGPGGGRKLDFGIRIIPDSKK